MTKNDFLRGVEGKVPKRLSFVLGLFWGLLRPFLMDLIEKKAMDYINAKGVDIVSYRTNVTKMFHLRRLARECGFIVIEGENKTTIKY